MEQAKRHNLLVSIASRIEITAIALAVACSVLYIFGMAFRRAYLAAFGIGSESFPLSADQAMMQAFEAYKLMSASAVAQLVTVNIAIVCGLIVGIFLLALAIDWIINRLWFFRIKTRVRRWMFHAEDEEPRRSTVFDFLVDVVGKVVVAIVGVTLILLISQSIAVDIGSHQATLVRDACSRRASEGLAFGWSAPRVRVQYEQPGTSTVSEVQGCLVAAGTQFIAIQEGSGVTTIPNARVVAIRTETK
jgi:hypothetical protein